MSMLAEPNTESPANVDAAKMWREDRSNNQFYKLGRSFSVSKLSTGKLLLKITFFLQGSVQEARVCKR